MSINRDKPDLWKNDISNSVDFYNNWFMEFAPKTFRKTRIKTASSVKSALEKTNYLLNISTGILKKYPFVLPILRMCTCPPIARDRLVGLAGVSKSLVGSMESKTSSEISLKSSDCKKETELLKLSSTLSKMIDRDIFVWIDKKIKPTDSELTRASIVVADRLCGSLADPIIRNAQEERQLRAIKCFLEKRKYRLYTKPVKFNEMEPGTFAFRTNVPVKVSSASSKNVNIPVDVLIMPSSFKKGQLPLLIEAKSAGDFTNVNKRRKEEATKMQQLKDTYGASIKYCLFLCGYFDSGYLGYESAEGIDWIWEHRLNDLELLLKNE